MRSAPCGMEAIIANGSGSSATRVDDASASAASRRSGSTSGSMSLIGAENSVPTLMGYGLIDHCVPTQLKDPLIDALKENGVPYDYVEFPKSNHGMYNDIDKLQEFINLSLEYCDKYFDK